jgi:hypothetical protein
MKNGIPRRLYEYENSVNVAPGMGFEPMLSEENQFSRLAP